MAKLTIKPDDYGLALYRDGSPWFYFKSGDDVVTLLKEVVPACNEVEYTGSISDEEREEHFC